MKKFLSALLIFLLALTLSACGNETTSSNTNTSVSTPQNQTVSTNEASRPANKNPSKLSSSESAESSKPVHIHKYSDATCTQPQKCCLKEPITIH